VNEKAPECTKMVLGFPGEETRTSTHPRYTGAGIIPLPNTTQENSLHNNHIILTYMLEFTHRITNEIMKYSPKNKSKTSQNSEN